jgi:UDP-glucose 4-epimerase
MNDQSSVLVTGGAGYVGSHAVLALLDAGYKVIVLDNLTTGFRSAVDPRAAFIEGGVENQSLVRSLLMAHRIESIMHFAGSVIAPESIIFPLKYYRNNTAASRTLIDSAVACNVRNFIFSSTAAIYGTPDTMPVTEATPPSPKNPYDASKLMTETMLTDAATAHSLNYCVLRYYTAAGADPGGRSGQSASGATNLIKAAIEVILGKRRQISGFGADYATPDGTRIRDFVHVTDLAAAHVEALQLLKSSSNQNLLLNCGYGSGFSVRQILQAVENLTGVTVRGEVVKRPPGDPDMLILDNQEILKVLDWKPQFNDLNQIVADTYRWERQITSRPSEPAMQVA